MASFERHVNVAVIATGITLAPLHTASIITTPQAFILLALGLIGGILPDLDSDNSKPIQIVFKILSIFFPLIIVLSSCRNLPILHSLLIWISSGLLLKFIFSELFLKQTVHRGIFHSIPMAILFGQMTLALFYYSFNNSLYFSTLGASFIFYGFIIHLLLDEFSSINALGLRIKKSFGSAFKFFDKNNPLGTIILYCLILILFYLLPIEKNVYKHIYTIFNSIHFV